MQNCSLLSYSSSSFTVNCTPGIEDGGLKPKFHLVAIGLRNKVEISNVSVVTDLPEFNVKGLEPGTTYELVMFASNAKGRSTTVEILASTLYEAERRTG